MIYGSNMSVFLITACLLCISADIDTEDKRPFKSKTVKKPPHLGEMFLDMKKLT